MHRAARELRRIAAALERAAAVKDTSGRTLKVDDLVKVDMGAAVRDLPGYVRKIILDKYGPPPNPAIIVEFKDKAVTVMDTDGNVAIDFPEAWAEKGLTFLDHFDHQKYMVGKEGDPYYAYANQREGTGTYTRARIPGRDHELVGVYDTEEEADKALS